MLFVVVAVVAASIALFVSYRHSISLQGERLSATSRSVGELLRTWADAASDVAPSSVAALLARAQHEDNRLEHGGEILIAYRNGDAIHPLAGSDTDMVPMRRALDGESGWMITEDARGKRVIAAFHGVPGLGAGVVVQVELAEIREPFLHAAELISGVAVLLALAGVLFFRRFTTPFVTTMETGENLYRTLFELSPIGIAIIDPDTLCVLDCNAVAHRQLGYSRKEFIGISVLDFDPSVGREGAISQVEKLRRDGYVQFMTHNVTKSGELRDVHVQLQMVCYEGRNVIYAIHHDLTERMNVERELKAHREHLEELVEARTAELEASNRQLKLSDIVFRTTEEGVFVTNAAGDILMVNPAFTEITGYAPEEVVGKNPRILKSHHQSREFYAEMWSTLLSKGSWRGQLWNRRKNGEAYLQQITITMFSDEQGNPQNYVSVFSDITELHEKEERIRHQAFHDALTDLPNRLLFNDRLEQALAYARRTGEHISVMYLDLDRFKFVNDTLGHNVGDQLLRTVARRITSVMRHTDTLSRFGGDEFVILATGIRRLEDVELLARNVVATFERPFLLDGHELSVTTSVGVAVYPSDGLNGSDLLKNADTAMYRAKEKGRNGIQFYTSDMHTRALTHVTLQSSLKRALEREEFEVHYQPRVRVADGRVCGMEALVRWRHPERGLVPPSEFIPVAEDTGFIVPLGEWVLARACEQTRAWADAGFPLRVSVNLSARQFSQPDLLERIDRIVRQTGIDPSLLEFELTETLVMDQPENTINILQQLKNRGMVIAIDDFGTGYSSLSYLKRFPIDILKIDRSFIMDALEEPDHTAIVETIAALGHSLRMEVIAEGVETHAQLELVRRTGCHAYQGYLYSPALPADRFLALLHNGGPAESGDKAATS